MFHYDEEFSISFRGRIASKSGFKTGVEGMPIS
jgi:hypothetical protein